MVKKCPECGHSPMVEPKGGNNKYGCLKCFHVIKRDGTTIEEEDVNTLIAKVLRQAPAATEPVIDCGCTDCEWYDEGRGYEECKWCSRFSKHIARETSKSLITDRYKPKGVA